MAVGEVLAGCSCKVERRVNGMPVRTRAGNGSLREQLTALDKLVAESRGQFDRLFDLNLAGDFVKAALLERKTRLADTIAALEREQEGLWLT